MNSIPSGQVLDNKPHLESLTIDNATTTSSSVSSSSISNISFVSTLNYYEEYTTTTFTFATNPFPSSPSFTLTLYRLNKTVSIRISGYQASTNSSATLETNNAPIPARFRPQTAGVDFYGETYFYGYDNGGVRVIRVLVYKNGNFNIGIGNTSLGFPSSAPFTSGANAGWESLMFQYPCD